jgi:DNA invertase Pin-like site-specific DNA recombinase
MRFISYLRVSTSRQGASGLGIEAQRAAVLAYAKAAGNGEPLHEYTEVESGRKTDKERPVLREAITRAKLLRATLIVAKLDRLARNVHFVSTLMESGVDFVAADMPQANRLTVHLLAAVAEAEAKAISERTKAALAAAKARGVKLGGRGNLPKSDATTAAHARAALVAKSLVAAEQYRDEITKARAAGRHSLRELAEWLNERHVPTVRQGGAGWQANSVRRLLRQLSAAERP